MSSQTRSHSIRQTLPFIGFFVSEWQVWHEEQIKPCYRLAPMSHDASEMLPYSIDMGPLLALPFGTLDEAGVPYNAQTKVYPAVYHPTTIIQYALAQWNAYLATGDEKHRQAFMIQANWLVAHESSFAADTGGWPIPFPSYSYNTSESWLSALTQGNAISVLVRAYQLTSKDVFLHVVRRAVRTFELDICNGGVSESCGEDGVFFEEVAAYPASRILNGYIYALFGLYDYVALTNDTQIAALIRRSLVTMHTLIDEFDSGYWTYYDLLHKRLASRFYHSLHVTLLEALAKYSGCEHCEELAARWAGYQHSRKCRLWYFIVSRVARYHHKLRRVGIRSAFSRIFRAEGQTESKSISIPITAPLAAPPGSVNRKINR